MSEVYEYYDEEWRDKVFQCPECGWSGTHEEMAGPNIFEELVDYACQRCDKMLLIVSHPYMSQTLEAAAAGNEYALFELGVMSGEGEHFEKFKHDMESLNRVVMESFDIFEGEKTVVMNGSVVIKGPSSTQ